MEYSLIEKCMLSTVRVSMLDELKREIGSATAFHYEFVNESRAKVVPVLVTNRHVVNGCPYIHVVYTTLNQGENRYILEINTNHAILHPNSKIDLAIIPMSNYIRELISYKVKPRVCYIDKSLIPTEEEWKNLDAVESLIMIGYPNGIWDEVNNFPIFRQGITATHPAYNFRNEPKFLADMSCFPGSSGSPVFLLNQGTYNDKSTNSLVLGTRIKLLGIQSESFFRHQLGDLVDVTSIEHVQKARIQSFINLGVIIKSSELLALQPLLDKVL